MRQFILYIIILTSISTGLSKGQSASTDTPVALEKLYGRLVNNYDDTDRLHINDSIRLILDSYVRSDSIFNHKFTNLRYLGQIISPDSTLKIVTWNLVLGNSPGLYFCYFIRKQENGKGNKVYSLTTAYRDEPVRTDTTYTESDWYGALYYDLKPYIIDDRRCWVLLGIDYGNPFVSRKIIDVLSFTSEDSLLLGRKWFESGDSLEFRYVFQYTANAMMTLRFASDKSIVFDHLVPFSQSQNNDRQYYGPDYSYDAYNFENGIWRMSVNVDARNKE
jgi:hypothetical protein